MEVTMAKLRIRQLLGTAILALFVISEVAGVGPEQGIFNKTVSLTKGSDVLLYEGFTKSMFKNSEVALSVDVPSGCDATTNQETMVTISWMIRYSECEGAYTLTNESASSILGSIFEAPSSSFPGEKVVTYYKTMNPENKLCAELNGPIQSDELDEQWAEHVLKPPTSAPKKATTKAQAKTKAPADPNAPDAGAAAEPGAAVEPNKPAREAQGDQNPPEETGKQRRAAEDEAADQGENTEKKDDPNPEEENEPGDPNIPQANIKATTKAPQPTKAPKTLVKNPLTRTPLDGRYIFIVKIEATNVEVPMTLELKIEMKSSKGYLSAFQWPLLPFYGVMCAVYSILAFIWLLFLGCNWRDLLRVQFWICGVLVLGLLEKAIFYAEFEHVNKKGISVTGAIIFAELISCLKRSLARMLLIIVSLGYGITRPRLGRDLHWVMAAGSAYFILSSVEGVLRVKGEEQHALIAILPLAVLDAVICWWIFKNLVDTTRQLRLRRNLTKLWLYRHVTNTLIVCIVCAVVFLIWSTKAHRWTTCVTKWRELWLDDAYWHVLFCIILTVIMVLIRPTANNQRYAFSPLVDAADDDESQQPMISDAYDTVKMRQMPGDRSSGVKSAADDALKWVEDNIPAAVADAALGAFDDSEEELVNTLERNKME